MNIEYSLSLLENSDTSVAFEALKELEKLSDTCDALYPHIEKFISMIDSEKYVIRARGFRLFCKQAKWDADNVIDRNLSFALNIFSDEKPTAVRQALAAAQDIVLHKPNLRAEIKRRALEIDYLRYRDTMHSLIAKDINALVKLIEEA